MMTDDNAPEEKKASPAQGIGKEWSTSLSKTKPLFARTEDFDIYCDRQAGQNYIFHAGELNCTVEYLEYDPQTQRITVFTNDGQKLDLGTRIQWLIRPYIAKDQNIFIVRTENREMKEGIQVPLYVKRIEEIQEDADIYDASDESGENFLN